MTKKKAIKKDNKSIKTFFLYTFIVFFVMLVSLSIKAIFVIRQSRYDGNSLNVAITQKNRVVSILDFNSSKNSISVLKIKNSSIAIGSIGQELGIIVDGKINSEYDLSGENPESILVKAAFGQDSIKTDLTIFDIARLILFSKNVSSNGRQVEEIERTAKQSEVDKIVSVLFKNDTLSTDNISIAVVNATDESGLGKRLERCLTNMGANVVAVTTPHVQEKLSRIEYLGQASRTLEKLKTVLKFPVKKIDKETVAKIVIIIGEDSKNPSGY